MKRNTVLFFLLGCILFGISTAFVLQRGGAKKERTETINNIPEYCFNKKGEMLLKTNMDHLECARWFYSQACKEGKKTSKIDPCMEIHKVEIAIQDEMPLFHVQSICNMEEAVLQAGESMAKSCTDQLLKRSCSKLIKRKEMTPQQIKQSEEDCKSVEEFNQ
jgi:hypothetical protein